MRCDEPYSIFIGPQQTVQRGANFQSYIRAYNVIGFGRSNSLGYVFDVVNSLGLKVGGLKGMGLT